MGQQQLLLLVLGIVIVGLAVVVGLQAFSENRAKAASDELVANGARIASEAIAWTLSAETLGGGGGDPSTFTFASMGYDEETDGTYRLGDGVYSATADAASIVISGEIAQMGSFATTAVYGAQARCVLTVSEVGSAPATPSAPAGCTW